MVSRVHTWRRQATFLRQSGSKTSCDCGMRRNSGHAFSSSCLKQATPAAFCRLCCINEDLLRPKHLCDLSTPPLLQHHKFFCRQMQFSTGTTMRHSDRQALGALALLSAYATHVETLKIMESRPVGANSTFYADYPGVERRNVLCDLRIEFPDLCLYTGMPNEPYFAPDLD